VYQANRVGLLRWRLGRNPKLRDIDKIQALPPPGPQYNLEDAFTPLATDGIGRLYALNRRAVEVTVYPSPDNPTGQTKTWKLQFGPGRSPAKPLGIAVDPAGENVYVTTADCFVLKHRSDGTYLQNWPTLAYEPIRPGRPIGIAVDDADMVYVADVFHGIVQRFHSDGKLVDVWGKSPFAPEGDPGKESVSFSAPSGIAVDGMRCVYVSERDTRSIKKLKLGDDPVLLATWDAKVADIHITTESIAVDRAGNIYLPGGIDSVYRGKQTWRPR
jgi:hypothetical protein